MMIDRVLRKEPVEGRYFSTIYRCKNRDECYRRAELAGEKWVVEDGRAA